MFVNAHVGRVLNRHFKRKKPRLRRGFKMWLPLQDLNLRHTD